MKEIKIFYLKLLLTQTIVYVLFYLMAYNDDLTNNGQLLWRPLILTFYGISVLVTFIIPMIKEFKTRKIDEPINSELNIPAVIFNLSSDWIKFVDEKPPHEIVVLAACETYDCGWVMDTVWWYEDEQRWMVTGTVKSTEAHLPYTHWRKLPPYPNEI